MARKNDLEVSPAQREGSAQDTLRARVQSLSKTKNEDRANDGENGEMSTDTDDDNARREGVTIASGQHREQQDDDDAEGLAGIINNVLSGSTQPGAKSAVKESESSWGQAFKTGGGRSISISQKQSKSLKGDNNASSGSARVQVPGNSLQVLAEGVSDNANVFHGDKSNTGKSLARPSVIYEDISKTQKPRSSGRPDPYDVPQSPPRSPDPESRTKVPQRRGPKSKQVAFRGKPNKTAAAVGEIPPSSTEGNSVDPQKQVEQTELSPDHATSKRATRSMRAKEYGLSDMKRDREKRQRMSFTGPQEPRETSHLARLGSISSREDQSSENQAGTPTVEYLESSNIVIGSSRSEPQLKDKSPGVETGDPQPRENLDLTPTNGRKKAEKASLEGNVLSAFQGVSPILSCPTPMQRIQTPSRKLPRPSITPKGIPNPKTNISTRQMGGGHVVKTATNTKIREIAHEEAIDEEDDAEHESRIGDARNPGLELTDVFINEATLDSLSSTIKRAGRNARHEKVIEDDNFYTRLAKTLCRATRRLTERYEIMGSLITASVVDVCLHDIEHEKAKCYLKIIDNVTKQVLRDRLGDPERGGRNADKDSRAHMLQDLYLYVVPSLVKALKAAANSQQNRATPATSDLEEFFSLLTILCDLVKAAVSEDKSIQPKAPRTNSYNISQPTRSIWPILQKLYKKCTRELADREAAKKLELRRQRAPEKIRKRKEQMEAEEQAAEEEYRRRQKERNRAILISLNERRAELGLPPCTQPISTPSNSQKPKAPKDEEEDQYDDASHDINGRLIGVFGRSNTHPGTTPKEWTKIEMEILVDGLRRERGM